MEYFLSGWYILGLLYVLPAVAMVIGHPIWSIYDCWGEEQRSKRKKINWTILMVLTWVYGSVFYGVYESKSKAMWRVSFFIGIPALFMLSFFALGKLDDYLLVQRSIREKATMNTSEPK